MHFAAPFCLSLIAAALLAGPVHSEDADAALRPYAIHIDRTQGKPLNGYGVYLGNGIAITAAHVVGGGDATKPQIKIAGERLPTTVVKDGHLSDVDLTILSVDTRQLPESLASRHMRLCENPHGTGEPVIVATPYGVARSYIMSPSILPSDVPSKFRTVISYVAETGNSGAGVFDANEKCLLGIISRKISGIQIKQMNGQAVRESVDIAKYFVPASEIAKFMPPGVRF
jgi:Trypsin-like peptidase domain